MVVDKQTPSTGDRYNKKILLFFIYFRDCKIKLYILLFTRNHIINDIK